MISLRVEYINNITNFAFRRDPLIIGWLKQYLRSSYRRKDKYLHYKGLVFGYARFNNKLIVFGPYINIVAIIGLKNFKKYCRTKKCI